MHPSADPPTQGEGTRRRSDISPFTPVPDELSSEIGARRAVIVGRIWRFSQMEAGRCTASLGRIGRDVGMSRGTVMRHIHWLCANGYLVDTTPDVRFKPHAYELSQRAGLHFATRSPAELAPEPGPPELAPEHEVAPPVRAPGEQARDTGVSVRDTAARIRDTGAPVRDAGVSIRHTKREVKRDSKRDSKTRRKRGNEAAPRAHQIPALALFHSVTGRYPAHVNFEAVEEAMRRVKGRLGRYPGREDLLPYYRAWTARGYNTGNLAWLEWAEAGAIPGPRGHSSRDEPRGFAGLREWLEEKGEHHG